MNTITQIPEFLKELLNKEYQIEIVNQIIEGYSKKRLTTFRVNNLKHPNVVTILKELEDNEISYQDGPIYDSFIIDNNDYPKLIKLSCYLNGEIYLQSLSSMVPPYVLDPTDRILDLLDMTAAPGSKTSLLSEMLNNPHSHIMAVEQDKIRCDRLKFNLNKLGCKNVTVLNQDATKLDDYFMFDSILLDAPCSGSGTLSVYDDSIKKFSLKLVNNSSNLQIKLLNKACKLLKPGSEMVYSTCSILSKENEEVINKILKQNNNIKIVPITGFDYLPLLPTSLDGVLKIMPNEYYEGFFVCKLIKIK